MSSAKKFSAAHKGRLAAAFTVIAEFQKIYCLNVMAPKKPLVSLGPAV
jgi:hypothetical protein